MINIIVNCTTTFTLLLPPFHSLGKKKITHAHTHTDAYASKKLIWYCDLLLSPKPSIYISGV